jgi:outer membrane protein assembly factor BamB
VVAGGVVYFGSGANGYVVAADATTGAFIWQSQPGVNPVFAPPLVADGVLYVADYGGIVTAYAPSL